MVRSQAKCHPEFYNRPIARILRILLLAEVAHNGTDNEKEKIGSWLRWLYRHPHGILTEKMRKELGIFVDIEMNGYMDNLNAYTMRTFIWAVIAFQTRFGRPCVPYLRYFLGRQYSSTIFFIASRTEQRTLSYSKTPMWECASVFTRSLSVKTMNPS